MKTGVVKFVGPARVYVKHDDYPGLAMSRSIGDLVAHSVGVSDEPELYIKPLDLESDTILILASDGLWEFISTEEALRIALLYYQSGSNHDPSLICQELTREAVKRWREHDTAVDDITCIVVYLRKGGAHEMFRC